MGGNKYNSLMNNAKDYVVIVFGLLLYAFAFCALILPHEIVIGGVAGIGTLVYFATNGIIPVAVTSYAVNLLLLAAAYKVVGRTFVLRTVFGVTVVAFGIGVFESIFMSIGHPLVPDRVVSVALGAILCGLGIGTTFIHNGFGRHGYRGGNGGKEKQCQHRTDNDIRGHVDCGVIYTPSV